MTIVSWILLGLLIMTASFSVLMYHAMTVAVEEREKFYTPVRPVDFDYIKGEKDWEDAEVEDAE